MVELQNLLERTDRWDRSAIAFTAAFALGTLVTAVSAWQNPLTWDSSVYTAMGKWIFSSGQYGFWENFRPPMLPALLGSLWRLGVPEVGYPRLLSATVSVAGLATVYLGSRDLFDGKTAALATALLASTYTYLFFSVDPLTGIPASILVFAGIYAASRERYLSSGLLLGAAFLTRFPAALAGPAVVAYLLLKGYSNGDHRDAVRSSVVVTAGFFAFTGAYLAVQYYFFGDMLSPFRRSVSITAGAGSSYLYGLSYLLRAAAANPLLALAPLGIYFAAREREWSYAGFGLAFLLFYGFFSSFPLKIDRYMLLFLPLMALLSARGATGLLERAPDSFSRERALQVVLALLFLLLAFNSFGVYEANSWVDPEQQEFFSHVSELEGAVASNDPRVNLYADFRYYPLPPGELMQVVDRHGEEIDYWAVNERYWDCRGYPDCEQSMERFEEYLEANATVTSKVLAGSYNYTVYGSR